MCKAWDFTWLKVRKVPKMTGFKYISHVDAPAILRVKCEHVKFT